MAAADDQAKAWLLVDLDDPDHIGNVVRWLRGLGVTELNVAGPRESEAPGIYEKALAFLTDVFTHW